jgi:hypothetical protein
VDALVSERLRSRQDSSWPAAVGHRLAARARAQALVEPVLSADVIGLLAALAETGIRALVLKGAHVAHTHYPSPFLRPRADTDLLIRDSDRPAADHVLASLGYMRAEGPSGDYVTHQAAYVRRLANGIAFRYDLHWRIGQPQVFARLLSFDELDAESVAIQGLGPHARGLGPVHALVFACAHRALHHQDTDRLIWVYDIHLLGEGLTPEEWERFVALARDRGVSALCARGLELARDQFGARIPGHVAARLTGLVKSRMPEPSAAFLEGGWRQIDVLRSDLRALPTWRARGRLVAEHLFPPASYMLQSHVPGGRALLPFLYMRRIAYGLPRWLRRHRP